MSRAYLILIMRAAALVALAASAALLVDALSAVPAFCGGESGCAAIRRAGLSTIPGTGFPVAAIGLMGFASLMLASFGESARWQRLTRILAQVGGSLGAALIALQIGLLGQLCWLCVTADSAAVVAAVAASLSARAAPAAGSTARLPGWLAWSLWSVLVVAGAFVWPAIKPKAPIPPVIAALYVDGRLNVVEFVDFQCPHCRHLHHTLGPILRSYEQRGEEPRLHFVRKHYPLESHRFALGAAKAAICAEQQGAADPMANHLFAAEELTPRANRRAAEELGLDLEAYDACLGSPATRARLEADKALLDEAGLEGLPTTYIGSARIVGSGPPETFVDALDAAARGDEKVGLSAPWFALILLGLAALAGWLDWVRHRARADPSTRTSPVEA